MEITAVRRNKTNPSRYSVFIDNKFSFSLSDQKLIELRLATGDRISSSRLQELEIQANEDKIYSLVLKYVSSRLKTQWQVSTYLKNKGASPTLTTTLLNKLSKLNLVNDYTYASAYISEKTASLSPSRRKLEFELQKKRISKQVIQKALDDAGYNEQDALKELIKKKRSKYPDKIKLMCYLASQGFNYGDIKQALES